MNVAMDTHSLYVTQAGTARYVRGLLTGFSELGDADLRINQLVWEVENFGYRQPMRSLKTAFRELVWAPFVAPLRLSVLNPDILHRTAPSLPIPHRSSVREVVTLHDLAILRQPKRFRRWQAANGRRHLKLLRRAAKIICVSQFTADEAMQLLNLPAKQLEVVHHGIEIEAPASETLCPQPPESFFLFVGSLEPGKNLSLLRQCYFLAQSQGISLPPLLIVGSRWQGVGSEGVPPENWRYLGHQTDGVLTDLYRRARALLFPSLYEGFGFPVLEAMARGCPVICGRVASLPEIGGGAAIYTDLDAAPYLQEMKRVLTEPEFRQAAVAASLNQSERFRWAKCASETLSVYRSVLN